jgi:hypothetical protein
MLYCNIDTCWEYSGLMSEYCQFHNKSYPESKNMNNCLICSEECKNDFGNSVHYEKIFKNQGLCCEHNFLNSDEDKNNIDNLDTIDGAQILSLLFLSDISNINFKTQFNRIYSEKIRTMLIVLSNTYNTDLYFKFISRIRQIVDCVYKKIGECHILNGSNGATHQLNEYTNFLTLSRVMTYVTVVRGNIIVEYLICKEEENNLFTKECEKCDTCDINFYAENAVMTVINEDEKCIKRECVNCRKFSMNCDFILNEFNEKMKIIMDEYSNVIISGNLNIDVLIMSFLFGENNARILYLKN